MMRTTPLLPPHRHRQSGAALLIALVMLVGVMMLGIAAARTALMNEKSSRNDRDRQIAFQAAEAALRDAELSMAGARRQTTAFPTQPGECTSDGAFGGLCRAAATPLWTGAGVLAGPPSVPFGRYSGAGFPAGAAALSQQAPRYLIELFSLAASGKSAAVSRYRITAIGFGPRAGTQVVVQAVYAFADGDATSSSSSSVPARLSWREIGNWQENAASPP